MVLSIRRIYATNGLFLQDVVHLYIPNPQIWKVVVMFVLIFLLPFTFSRGLLDAYCARNLHELVSAILSLLRPNSTRSKLHKIGALLANRASAAAFLIFAVKCYVCHKGVKVENEGISFNQPVIYRTANPPLRSECKLMTPKDEHEFTLWEAKHCTLLKGYNERIRTYPKVTYIPSARTVDGSEQRCLSRGISSVRGSVEVVSISSTDNHLDYEHPVFLIKNYCKNMSVNCSFIRHASSRNDTTWIHLGRPDQKVILRFHNNQRPGLTTILETSLAVNANASKKNRTKIALGVEQAMRHSSCFAKRKVVETVKVAHLIIHIVPLLLLFLLESICRRHFKHIVDTTHENEEYEEYLGVAMEEGFS